MENKPLTWGELTDRTYGYTSTETPVFCNGQPVTGVAASRNAAGDLQLHLHTAGLPAQPEQPERRQNDPATLTTEEQEALKLTETLGGVEEQRAEPDAVDAATGSVEPAEPAPDLGDAGSEDSAL